MPLLWQYEARASMVVSCCWLLAAPSSCVVGVLPDPERKINRPRIQFIQTPNTYEVPQFRGRDQPQCHQDTRSALNLSLSPTATWAMGSERTPFLGR